MDAPQLDTAHVNDIGRLTPEGLAQTANELLGQNRYREAYPYVSALAVRDDAAAATCVTAGLVALLLKRPNDAAAYFERACRKEPHNYDAVHNLALIALSEGRLNEAQYLFASLLLLYPDRPALYSDLAIVLGQQRDTETALELIQKSLRLDPNFAKARDNAMHLVLEKKLFDRGFDLLDRISVHPDVIPDTLREIESCRHRLEEASIAGQEACPPDTCQDRKGPDLPVDLTGKKIAFFAAQGTFVKDIIEHLAGANETRTFTGQSPRDMAELLQWADLAWFEWCDGLIIEATRLPRTTSLVCRLHSYEVFTDMPGRVDWSKVDRLIFVADSVRKLFQRQTKAPIQTAVIHNGVDTDRFVIPKSKNYGKKIASVGYINYKKNPALLLHCFKKIHEYDSDYTLHIAGQHQDPRIQVYFEHFLRRHPLPVHFDGWVEDMPAWYADKDYVISTSLFESFHYSIAEGMACGLLPLIHDWYGAEDLYPSEYLFADPDECLSLLKQLEAADKAELAQNNRRHIVNRYNRNDQYREIDRLLADVCAATGK
ncbi:MAG: glycosyltransferase [Candidatus Zixiibacteriota bacterium]